MLPPVPSKKLRILFFSPKIALVSVRKTYAIKAFQIQY